LRQRYNILLLEYVDIQKFLFTLHIFSKNILFLCYQNDIKMNGKILFTEQQKFRQIWFWMLLIVALSLPMINFLVEQVKTGNHLENYSIRNTGFISDLILLIVLPISVIILFSVMRVETVITTEGVRVKFFPLHLSFREYKWERISKIYIREYSSLIDFGGWGIRFNFVTNTVVYNMCGNQGLQLELKNGKKILVGTQKKNELEVALKQIEPFIK